METLSSGIEGTASDLARRAAETSPDPLLLIDRSGIINYANAAARVFFGDEALREPVASLLHLDGPPIHQLLGGSGMARRATAVLGTDDHQEVDITIGPGDEGSWAITLRRQIDPGVSTIELLRRATHDDLTQLANRASFVERVAEDTRHGDPVGHALIMLDLDGFKLVNDGFGHEVGDQVLVEVARRLRESCRPNDLISRLGGDEFALWCPGVRDDATIVPLINRLLEAIEEPIPIASSAANISASIGVVLTADGLIETSDLLARADAAMYRAKALGQGRFVTYDDKLGRDLVRARSLERSLSEAINTDALMLHYQAVIDLVSNDPVGAEALVRWPHERLGLIAPTELVEVATRTHLLTSMSNWVLRSALAELGRWNRVLPKPIGVSVNLATSQLTANFVDLAVATLAEHEIHPSMLTIEVTEEVLSPRHAESVELLEELHEMGIRIAIDDFGTGRSSLHALQEFPVDALKIDPVFVHGLAGSKRQAAIVEAIVQLAHALDLYVVAEGVETSDDLQAARELGCDLAQGFIFAAPAPAASVDWLPRRR